MLLCSSLSGCRKRGYSCHYSFDLSTGIFTSAGIPLFKDERIAFVYGVSSEPYVSPVAGDDVIKMFLLNFFCNRHARSLFFPPFLRIKKSNCSTTRRARQSRVRISPLKTLRALNLHLGSCVTVVTTGGRYDPIQKGLRAARSADKLSDLCCTSPFDLNPGR